VSITYPDSTTATITTNSSGIYTFTSLAPGTYKIVFATPTGFLPSLSNQGGNDAKDSDPISGIVSVTITAGTINTTVDAGFYSTTANGCPGNLLSNTNGYYGGFEAGTGNIISDTIGSDLSYGLPRNGSYEIVHSVNELGGGGYLNITSHSGSY